MKIEPFLFMKIPELWKLLSILFPLPPTFFQPIIKSILFSRHSYFYRNLSSSMVRQVLTTEMAVMLIIALVSSYDMASGNVTEMTGAVDIIKSRRAINIVSHPFISLKQSMVATEIKEKKPSKTCYFYSRYLCSTAFLSCSNFSYYFIWISQQMQCLYKVIFIWHGVMRWPLWPSRLCYAWRLILIPLPAQYSGLLANCFQQRRFLLVADSFHLLLGYF